MEVLSCNASVRFIAFDWPSTPLIRAKLRRASLVRTEPFLRILRTDTGILEANSKLSKTAPETVIFAKFRVSTNLMRRACPWAT